MVWTTAKKRENSSNLEQGSVFKFLLSLTFIWLIWGSWYFCNQWQLRCRQRALWCHIIIIYCSRFMPFHMAIQEPMIPESFFTIRAFSLWGLFWLVSCFMLFYVAIQEPLIPKSFFTIRAFSIWGIFWLMSIQMPFVIPACIDTMERFLTEIAIIMTSKMPI